MMKQVDHGNNYKNNLAISIFRLCHLIEIIQTLKIKYKRFSSSL